MVYEQSPNRWYNCIVFTLTCGRCYALVLCKYACELIHVAFCTSFAYVYRWVRDVAALLFCVHVLHENYRRQEAR
jgi:hypothetical protein